VTAYLDVRLVKKKNGRSNAAQNKKSPRKKTRLFGLGAGTNGCRTRLNHRNIAKFRGNAGVNAFELTWMHLSVKINISFRALFRRKTSNYPNSKRAEQFDIPAINTL
jgi:hypothetical protein